jgi:hypothetical protein
MALTPTRLAKVAILNKLKIIRAASLIVSIKLLRSPAKSGNSDRVVIGALP